MCPSQLTKTYGEVSPCQPLPLDPPYHVPSSLLPLCRWFSSHPTAPSCPFSSTSHSLSPVSPCLQTLYKYYPGSLERLVVVNAPMGGQTIYRILTNVLPASFAEKVPVSHTHTRMKEGEGGGQEAVADSIASLLSPSPSMRLRALFFPFPSCPAVHAVPAISRPCSISQCPISSLCLLVFVSCGCVVAIDPDAVGAE